MKRNAMMVAVAVFFAVLVFSTGCAGPGSETTWVRLTSIRHGMSIKEVQGTLDVEGEPVFAFRDKGRTLECRYFAADEGETATATFFLLWVNDRLSGVRYRQGPQLLSWSPGLAVSSAYDFAEASLPHADGPGRLTAGFNSMGDRTLAQIVEGKPRYVFQSDPVWPWVPVIIITLPITIVKAPIDIIRHNYWYGRMYSLKLDMTLVEVTELLGDPDGVLGGSERYKVWVFRRGSMETKRTLSIGFRDDRVVWIRYYYDAMKDYLCASAKREAPR